MGKALRFLVALAVLTGVSSPRSAWATTVARKAVTVVVPAVGDMQALAYWVALGARYFEREGLDVQTLAPQTPGQVVTELMSGQPAALLSGADYERLIADGFPFALAANVFENDPYELVLKRDAVERAHLNTQMPLRERLRKMANMSFGMTVPARGRFYALYFSQGLDANQGNLEVRKPEELLLDYESGKLDGLYVASPLLEKVLAKDGIVMVDPAGGEIAETSKRVALALGVSRELATSDPAAVAGLVRGIARAEALVRSNVESATAAAVRALPSADAAAIARVVRFYAKGVPATPRVDPKKIAHEVALLPPGAPAPKLAGVDLKRFILDQPEAEQAGGLGRRGWALVFGAALVGLALLVAALDQRQPG